ncbi:MAG: hypothetical protein A3I05_02425 [Deltaproteobacteria bacterium RIFCSPLOWO2_02_FULL_44_10]|nr:MAG: hypothetical protein A3I05_02425 [Deltaproteobacteria bacterium RIFCSPLOWO2_02_FULL_44_10]
MNQHHQLGRAHFFFYALLSLCILIGIFSVNVMVESHQAKQFLTLLFIAILVTIAAGQLFVQYILMTRFLSPLAQFVKDLRAVADRLHEEAPSLETIRSQLTHLLQLSAKLEERYPNEIRELHVMFTNAFKALECQLETAMTDKALVTMGQLCGHVAHDMRGPLTAMKTFLECAPETHLSETLIELKHAAHKSCIRLHQMAEELLDQKRSTQIERKPIDLVAVIKSVCAELNTQAQQHRIAFAYKGPNVVSYTGDADKLSRVFQNIFQNGIQAMVPQQQGTVNISLETEDENIVLDIRDTGPGIPQTHLDKIFLPDFTTKGNNGTGLGLAYCQNVITKHAGTIHASNHQTGGALFRIMLPNHVVH